MISFARKQTFPGGVHPPDKKNLTSGIPIAVGPVPKQVSMVLSQHIGAICQPLVQKNDEIEFGQKIAQSEAFVSAAIHSPVNGKVKEIGLQSHAVLGRCMAILIDVNSEKNVQKQPVSGRFDIKFNENRLSQEQILDAVTAAGIVGMGGAGFPTRVKLAPDKAKPGRTLIVNACECEPYITCDYRVMLEWTAQVITGIKLARKAADCKKVYIGIENNKPLAIQALRKAVAESGSDMEVVVLETKYPQGGERQLINSVLKQVVPTGGIPPMIGVVVINVATAAAIADAVVLGNPLTHRVVTVTGEAIANPANLYVPIGISVGELVEYCGGVTKKSAKVVMGGPMMGIAVADLTTPTTKATGSILVLTKEQIGKAKSERRITPCIRCGRCLDVCPEHINPTKIAHAVKHGDLELAQDYFMSACIECGCCSYICPANIELTGYIKTGKITLARQKRKMPK